MRKTKICVWFAAIVGAAAASAATVSDKTPAVVGFKPWYENSSGQGAFSGNLEVGSEIIVDLNELGYRHEFAHFPDHDHDLEKSETRWFLDGTLVANNVHRFTLPADSVGKKLMVELIPFSKSGDPVRGKQLVISDLRAAGVAGGDKDGNISDNLTPPSIHDLRISGRLEVGQSLNGTYTFTHNGGNQSDKSRYQWGRDGSSNGVPRGEVVSTSGVVPDYNIVVSDLGSIIDLSVKAINGAAVEGNTLMVSASEEVISRPSATRVMLLGFDLFPGNRLSGRYDFNSNGGSEEGLSRYQWGHKGTTNTLLNYKEMPKPGEDLHPIPGSRKIPEYTIQDDDVGQLLEFSIQPVNKDNIRGDVVTRGLQTPVPRPPAEVKVHN